MQQHRPWKRQHGTLTVVGEEKVTFKLDTGTEVIAVSKYMYNNKLRNAPLLNTPQCKLCGSSTKPLNVLDQCWREYAYKEMSSNQQIFVVYGLRYKLLGLPAIKALNLAAKLEETTAGPTLRSQAYIHQKFASYFRNWGT